MPGGYFYNSWTGNVAIEHGVTGFISQLESWLPGPWQGPFKDMAAVQAYAAAHHGPAPHLNASIPQQVGGATTGLLGGVNAGNILLRVGEVILGIVLVAVGLNALLKNPAGKAVAAVA